MLTPVPTGTPEAEYLRTHHGRAVVRCPLCDDEHRHENFVRNHTEWRSAGCSLYAPINRASRSAGYTFMATGGRTQ